MQICWIDYNFVRVEVASHENDHGEVPPNHAVEDVNWVHKGSSWVCKINGCINSYVVKWLFCCHLDNKHKFHLEIGKSNCPFPCLGGLNNKP
jgi:hypothetical protein